MESNSQGPENEGELVRAASQGDGPALEALLERHLPDLRAFLRLRMGPRLRARESASDLAQSVCREVLEHLGRFRYGGEAEFRNWLYREALRKVSNRQAYYAAQKRDVGREVHLEAETDDWNGAASAVLCRSLHTPSAEAAAQEEVERLQRAFDRLSADHREVILLAKMVGLPHRRIAEEMGRTETAARALLHRALMTLASELERNG